MALVRAGDRNKLDTLRAQASRASQAGYGGGGRKDEARRAGAREHRAVQAEQMERRDDPDDPSQLEAWSTGSGTRTAKGAQQRARSRAAQAYAGGGASKRLGSFPKSWHSGGGVFSTF